MTQKAKAPASVAAESEGQDHFQAKSECPWTDSQSIELSDARSVRRQSRARHFQSSGPLPAHDLTFQDAKIVLADWARDIANQGRRAEILGEAGLLSLEQLYAVGDEVDQWRSACIWVANQFCRKGGRQ